MQFLSLDARKLLRQLKCEIKSFTHFQTTLSLAIDE